MQSGKVFCICRFKHKIISNLLCMLICRVNEGVRVYIDLSRISVLDSHEIKPFVDILALHLMKGATAYK